MFCKLNARLHRRVYGNLARKPFCNLYLWLLGEHIATLPGKCFARLMGGRSSEYMATLLRNLLASFMRGSHVVHIAALPGKYFLSLMRGHISKYIAALPRNLLAS